MIIKTCLDLLHGQTLQNTNAINFIQPSCCPVTEAAFSLHLSPAASVAVIYRFYELRLSVRGERTQEAATHEVSMGIACEVTICRINPTAAVNSPGLHNGGNLLPFR